MCCTLQLVVQLACKIMHVLGNVKGFLIGLISLMHSQMSYISDMKWWRIASMAFQCRHNIIMINTCSNLIFSSIIFMIKTIPFSSHFLGPQNFVGSSSFHKYLCSHSSGKFYAQLHPIQFMFNSTLFQQDFVVSSSLIPNPKEEKGPGFSCSRMCK